MTSIPAEEELEAHLRALGPEGLDAGFDGWIDHPEVLDVDLVVDDVEDSDS
jgi:hypothetical protein